MFKIYLGSFYLFIYVRTLLLHFIKLPVIGARWYAKRFLHPDIVARYDYIFIWDEDLGVEHFDAEE